MGLLRRRGPGLAHHAAEDVHAQVALVLRGQRLADVHLVVAHVHRPRVPAPVGPTSSRRAIFILYILI